VSFLRDDSRGGGLTSWRRPRQFEPERPRFVLPVGAVGFASGLIRTVATPNSMGTLKIIRFSPHRPRICGLLGGPEPGLNSLWNRKMSPSCRWGLRAARLINL